uniref:Heat-shock protein n=1 Tax=Heterorhabditis bacteriophora TaxID=37862 RepID=A0A1I7XMZ4_HETBA
MNSSGHKMEALLLISTVVVSDFTANKRAFDSLSGSGLTPFNKRAFDSVVGSGFVGFDKRAFDSMLGNDFTAFNKRAFDSLADGRFGGFDKRAFDSMHIMVGWKDERYMSGNNYRQMIERADSHY